MKIRKRIPFLLLFLALAFAFLRTGQVQAHEVEPETSQPAPGIALGESPAEVVLVFPEELTEEGSSLQVLDANGGPIAISGGGVDLNDAQHATLRAGLPALPEGVYQVKWSITLTDGDSTSGSYHFGVGKVVVPTEAPEEAEAAAADAGLPAGQTQGRLPAVLWVAVVVLLAAAGAVVFTMQRKK